MPHVLLLALAATVMLAGPARAAITASSITAPTDLSYFVADNDAASSDVTISGTTSGGNPASDKIDVRCYYGAGTSVLVRSARSLNPDGSFSFAAPLGSVANHICVLRAIPAGSFPSDVTPFTGPRIATGQRTTFTVAGGPNVGKVYDFYLWAQQQTAAFEYGSNGSCALFAGHLFDASMNLTTDTFFCNAWFDRFDAPTATRSGLRIDGANAYPVWAADKINGAGSGLPGVTYSYALDPSNGNLVIHSSEPLVKCADPTYPPTATSCATFLGTGVTYNSTISQDHDGHMSSITDGFSSTDGAAHSLDLLWENDQRFHGAAGDSTQLAYQFPGQSAFARHSPGDVITLPATPGIILIHMDGAADGDPNTGQGAIVYDRPADSATFIYGDPTVEEFNLHQTATVPAGGSSTFRFVYVQDYSAAAVASLAQTAADPFASPSVEISSPADATVVHAPSVTVTGTASDNVGVASLTVAGHAVTVGAGGAWSTTVPLSSGANTITAVARDAAGDTGQAQVTVTYAALGGGHGPKPKPKTKCTVPNVKGKMLAAAKKGLSRAHCRAGKVSRKRSKTVRTGRVISTNPKAGTTRPSGTKVGIVVSRGRH
jgi:Glucodextranase, domain B/PASTA domain